MYRTYPTTGRAVEDRALDDALRLPPSASIPRRFMDAAADELDRELPGYECDVEYDDGVLFAADNYDEVKHDFIARKLEEFGWDPDEYEEEIYGALDARAGRFPHSDDGCVSGRRRA